MKESTLFTGGNVCTHTSIAGHLWVVRAGLKNDSATLQEQGQLSEEKQKKL